jgi:hypothetical protein
VPIPLKVSTCNAQGFHVFQSNHSTVSRSEATLFIP